MKIAIINDLHSGARNDLQVFTKYMESYFADEFFPAIDERNVKVLIHLGDLFDRRKFINFYTLSQVRSYFLDELKKRGIHMHIIPGNHDIAYKNTSRLNSLDLLLEPYENVTIHHHPEVISYDGQRIGLVPWINEENYDECLSFIENNADVDWLGGHFEVNGAEMNAGITCEHGLPASTFKDYELVISGHFHTPSQVGNVWYPGNQIELTWNDYGQDKKFLVYDTETNDFEKILTKSRMFHKVFYDDTDEFELKKRRKEFSSLQDKYVKVIVRNKTSKVKFESFLADLYNHAPYDVTIIESDIELGLSDEEMNIEAKSTMEIIDMTVENMTIDVDKKDLKQLFHELYNEALQIEV